MQSTHKINLNEIPCAYIATNLDSKITAVNNTLCQWLNQPEQVFIGRPFSDLLTMPSRMLFLGSILPHIQKNQHIEENYLQLKTQENDPLPVMINAEKIIHDGTEYYSYAIMKMNRRHLIEEQLIAERRRAEMAIEEKEAVNLELKLAQQEILTKQKALEQVNAELEALSTTDPLTQLANRRVYERELTYQLALFERTQHVFSIILFDIDHFKRINDEHGHDAGDSVLQQLANILTPQLRQTDILTRIGGEEFVILLPNTTLEQALDVAEKKRQAIAQAQFVCGAVSASFGVTQVQPQDTLTKLYKRVDQALYLAKQQGRNRVNAG